MSPSFAPFAVLFLVAGVIVCLFETVGPRSPKLRIFACGLCVFLTLSLIHIFENEYGSFGDDRAYMEGVKAALLQSGMGDTLLYTADGPSELPKGSLPELPAVINFGTGEAERSFAKLEQLRPNEPHMSGEYWAGWFDHWGDKHHETDGSKEAAELRWMLQQGYSVSMYMFHGGTTFGFMNGANSNGRNYQPDTTSYDYDAPLDEKGEPRAKFFEFRKVIAELTGGVPPALPASTRRIAFPIGSRMRTASLWRSLPAPVQSKTLLTFEDLNQEMCIRDRFITAY